MSNRLASTRTLTVNEFHLDRRHDAAAVVGAKPTALMPQPLVQTRSSIQPHASHFSERVRDLFNDRAQTWGNLYRPRGKLTWRLTEFCTALGEVARPPAEVLDFGCGTGHLAKHLTEHRYVVTACDMAEKMIATARRAFGDGAIKWASLPADWRKLPFADRTFDAVTASSVFEYVEDLELVLSELARVLRDGGVLIFNVPDIRNGRRKREYWANRVMRLLWIRRTIGTIPRIRRYLHYLQLSKNRFPLAEWESIASRHGLHRLQSTSHRPANRPLFLFTFRKVGKSDSERKTLAWGQFVPGKASGK